MKSARKIKGFLAITLAVSLLFPSFNGFGGVLSNDQVEAKEDNSDLILTANMFDYDRNTVNNATVNGLPDGSSALMFHAGGNTGISESGKYYNQYTYWNLNNGNKCGRDTYGGSFQGIVQNQLVNNLPVFNYPVSDLFSTSVTYNKAAVYPSVGIQFVKTDDGYYEFDSDQHIYKYDANLNQVKITGEYQSWEKGGFWPLDNSSNYHNYWFGLSVPINFNVSVDGMTGDKDTVFEFTGDDDVWVYIDGKLVVDIGGIHQTVASSINFRTGEVKTNDVVVVTRPDYIDYAQKTVNLYELLGYSNQEECLKALSTGSHTLSVFYLERGAGESNCKIKFNFAESSASIPTDVAFTKTDINNQPLVGASFGLYSASDSKCENEPVYTAVSNGNGTNNVVFDKVSAGTYYLKEMQAPDGYALSEAVYQVTVENGSTSISSTGVVTTTQGSFVIKDSSQNVITNIINYTPSEGALIVDKTAKLTSWEGRTYDITMKAYTNQKNYSVNYLDNNVNAILVLDRSGSMADGEYEYVGKYKDVKSQINGDDTYYCYGDNAYRQMMFSWNYWTYYIVSDDGYYHWITDDEEIYRMTNKIKMDSLKTASKSLTTTIAENSSDSQIGVVSFASKDYTEAKVDFSIANAKKNIKKINKAIDSLSAKGGTTPSAGLQKALEQLNKVKNSNPKYVILVTDGEPTGNGYMWNDQAASDAEDIAKQIRDKGIKIYTIGFSVGTRGSKWLADSIASEGCAKYASSSEELNYVFEQIRQEMFATPNVENATVKDYIDSRFSIMKDGKEVTPEMISQAGGSIAMNDYKILYDAECDLIYVEWDNQTIPYSEDGTACWQRTITVTAKDNYAGGNDVFTNGPLSGVYTQEQEPVLFEQPKVNVRLKLVPGKEEDTIFLGENLSNYFSTEKAITVSGMNNMDCRDVDIVYSWIEEGLEKQGSLDEFVSYIKTLSPEEESVYALHIKAVPKVAASSEQAQNAAKSMQKENDSLYTASELSVIGTYTVKIVSGQLTIKKVFEGGFFEDLGYTSSQEEKINAKQSAVFTVCRYADAQCTQLLESYEVTVRDDNEDGVTLKNLRVGYYKVQEQESWSWKYKNTNVTKENNDVCVKNDTVYMGSVHSGNSVEMYAQNTIDYTNTLRHIPLYSDTTNVVNNFGNVTARR